MDLSKEELKMAADALRHQLAIEDELGVSNMVGSKTRLIWKLQDEIWEAEEPSIPKELRPRKSL